MVAVAEPAWAENLEPLWGGNVGQLPRGAEKKRGGSLAVETKGRGVVGEEQVRGPRSAEGAGYFGWGAVGAEGAWIPSAVLGVQPAVLPTLSPLHSPLY